MVSRHTPKAAEARTGTYLYTVDFEAEQELNAEDEATLRYNDLGAFIDSHQAPGSLRYLLRLSATDRNDATQKLHSYILTQFIVLTRLNFWTEPAKPSSTASRRRTR